MWPPTGATLLELPEAAPGACSNAALPLSEACNMILDGVTEGTSYVVNEKFFHSIFHIGNVLNSRINKWRG